jgi:sugar lactone lactonase YvrE
VLTLVTVLLGALHPGWMARAEIPGTITTVAGNGDSSFGGDGGPATQASMYEPRMMAFDRTGVMYITDTFNQVIRKVDRNGVMSTVAGKPSPVTGADKSGNLCPSHFAGDGGPAAQALLSCPHSLVVNDAGDVLVADSGNNRIRRIDARGIITTVVGTGAYGSSGDGGPGALAKLVDPKGVALDAAGNLYIADTGNHRIRRVDAAGVISTVVGTGAAGAAGDGGPAGQAQLSEPRTLAFDQAGNLYITEPKVNRIRKVDAAGIITLFAGTGTAGFAGDGGPATKAQLSTPRGVAADAAGTVYIADSLNQRVRRVGVDGVITTIAGTGTTGFGGDGGPAEKARVFTPRAVAVWDTDLYISDTYNQRIRKVAGIASGAVLPVPASTTSSTTTTTLPPILAPVVPMSAPPAAEPKAAPAPSGYWMLGADGRVHPFGEAGDFGYSTVRLPTTAVDLEPAPARRGYWVLDSAGHVFAFGEALRLGDVDPARLATGETAASLSATPSGRGYWVFTSRGRVLPFGDAPFLGDVSGLALNGLVLDSVATTTGRGYYMVASDGGIFTFGDGRFLGSMGDRPLNAPVQSLVPDGDGAGYWLVASDGGIFAFDAPFRGSMGATPLNRPVTGMVGYGNGYLMVAEDGGVFAFSDLPFAGSLGDRPPDRPIVSVAAL